MIKILEIFDRRTGIISKIPLPCVEGKITIYENEADYIQHTTTKNIKENLEITDLKELLKEQRKVKRRKYMREYQRKEEN